MSAFRLASAPRLIEWTGERCVPWSPDAQNVYEHLHRYLWAAPLVADRRVLDLASGEGFGAATLAESASGVIGLDVDQLTVEHSTLNYRAPNLEFRVGDAQDLSSFDAGSFGAVVALEMIEHVADQERVLGEIARVLDPNGVLIMSTPDRRAYSELAHEQNPFHVRELTTAEFTKLLTSQFANVATWGQRPITGSALSALGESSGADGVPQFFVVERIGDSWRLASDLSPLFVVAVASNAALPPIAANSVLADSGLEAVRVAEDNAEKLRHELDTQWRNAKEFADRALRAESKVAALESELAVARPCVERVEGSVTWQLFERVRATVFRVVGGEGSTAARALQSALRVLGRLLLGDKRAAGS
jgi:ubiquinone/menaquinone biosynthesis C-methylase UbiE